MIIKPREKSIAKLKNSLKRIIIMHKPLEKIVGEANRTKRLRRIYENIIPLTRNFYHYRSLGADKDEEMGILTAKDPYEEPLTNIS